MTRFSLEPRFVEFIPDRTDDGILYVSMEYMIVVHKCCCGCGNDVSLPLSPTDWQLTFDGKTVSLHPSIGSWSLPCRSHYWIRGNQIIWAKQWSLAEVAAGRAYDRLSKDHFYGQAEVEETQPTAQPSVRHGGVIGWFKRWWS
jgi:hypothetical protein